jgi:hypothetical protein
MDKKTSGRALFNVNQTLFVLLIPCFVFVLLNSEFHTNIFLAFFISSFFLILSFLIERKISLVQYLESRINKIFYFMFGFLLLIAFFLTRFNDKNSGLLIFVLIALFPAFLFIQNKNV